MPSSLLRPAISAQHSSARVPALDGLRGIAILVVFLNHGARLPLGWLGVDLFFVLSGFLITGVLLDLKAAGRGYFAPFYRRRALRILPPYLLTLLVYALVYGAHDLHPWPLFAFFGMNLQPFFAARGPGYLPLWSLAIEEQFYLLWPCAVLLFSTRNLRRLALAMLVLTPMLRIVCTPLLYNEFIIYTLTPFRADALCAGAALLLLWRDRTPLTERLLRRYAGALAVGGYVLLGGLEHWRYFHLSSDRPLANGLVYTLSITGAAGLVASALVYTDTASWLHRLLTWRPLRYTGRVSYSLYLVHVMVLVELARWVPQPWLTLPGLALTLAYATLSWFAVERPLLRLGKRC